MSKKSVLVISIGFASLLTSSVASAAKMEKWQELKSYIGVDVQVHRMGFQKGYGDNLLSHDSPQRNFYAGVKWNDWVGLEIGYETIRTRKRNVILHTGDIAAGASVPDEVSPAIFRSSLKMRGPHVNLIGFYALREDLSLQFIGSIGVNFFKGTVERRCLSMSNPPVPGGIRIFSGRKAVLRLMGGLEYKWNCHFGGRATVGLVKTGKVVFSANDESSGSIQKIKPKDSVVYGLGVFWVF